MYHHCLYLIVCDAGFYGAKCQQECSKFCSKELDCYPASGYCIEGCKRGWEGPKCLVGKAYVVHFISENCVKIIQTLYFSTLWSAFFIFVIVAESKIEWKTGFIGLLGAMLICIFVPSFVLFVRTLKNKVSNILYV